MVKMEFQLFYFIFIMNVNKDIHVYNFQDFFNSVRFLSFKADRMLKALAKSMITQICRRYQLIIYDFDELAFTFIFLTVCDNSVMTDFEYSGFHTFKIFQMSCMKAEKFC